MVAAFYRELEWDELCIFHKPYRHGDVTEMCLVHGSVWGTLAGVMVSESVILARRMGKYEYCSKCGTTQGGQRTKT